MTKHHSAPPISICYALRMPINKILQSDWCCDYSCSDTSAIRDCHQTLALRALVWLWSGYARLCDCMEHIHP